MAEKRIIEQTSSTEIYSGDWFVKDSAADGTTKIQPSKVKEYMNAGTATSDDLADEYDSTHSYSEGDVCTYEDVLYKANASTTGTWDITKWDAVTVADLIEEGGKVKDVKVNGTSVVDEDKIANVSVPVLDVTVNGGSVVNNSKVAVLDALATYGEASGAIVTFSDGSDLPVKELKVTIEPVQSGSGDPSPVNERPIVGRTESNISDCGKNYFGAKLTDFQNGTVYGLTKYIALKLPYNTYTISSNAPTGNVWAGRELPSPTADFTRVYDGTSKTVTTDILYIGLASADLETAYSYNTMIEVGSQPTAYAPYNGHAYTIDLDGTRYGCTLDVTSGVLAVKWVNKFLKDFDFSIQNRPSNIGGVYFKTNISSSDKAVRDNDATQLYSHGTAKNPYSFKGNHSMAFNSINNIFVGFADDMNINTQNDFDTWVTNNPTASICYELATPIEVQLTPTQVNTILGENNLFADSGDINKVVYVRDNSLIIDNILSRLEALEG